jgi:hypothetical protein
LLNCTTLPSHYFFWRSWVAATLFGHVKLADGALVTERLRRYVVAWKGNRAFSLRENGSLLARCAITPRYRFGWIAHYLLGFKLGVLRRDGRF